MIHLNLFLHETAGIAVDVGQSFLHILPYLALTIPLAVILKRSGTSEKIKRGLGSSPHLAVLMATLLGALSPFCSCGVIPIITALLLGGVPLAPVMSFWLASPSMDPEIFILSIGSIGWELAIWRLVATFIMSLGGGLTVLYLQTTTWIGNDFLRPSIRERAENGSQCGCSTKPEDVGLLKDSIRTTLNLSFYMLIAFFLEALIIRYVPQELIASHLGVQSAWGVPLATLLSIPMYTTNLTSLGLIAGLLQRGMSGGAAIAFLIGGAVTTLPAMSAVFGIVRWRVFMLYLGFCVTGSLLSGFAYQLIHMISE